MDKLVQFCKSKKNINFTTNIKDLANNNESKYFNRWQKNF
jgi:hypothetical protein